MLFNNLKFNDYFISTVVLRIKSITYLFTLIYDIHSSLKKIIELV